MSQTQPIHIDVHNIEKCEREDFFTFDITFKNDRMQRHYPFDRKVKRSGNESFIIIQGCRITFNESTLAVVSITREYDVKGNIRKSTANQSKKYGKKGEQKITDLILPEPKEAEDWDWSLKDDGETGENAEQKEAEEKQEEEQETVTIPKKVRHEKYSMIKDCLESDIPVYLAGPAGSGKNYTVEQIARENGWNFYYTNSVQQEYKLTGFIDAGGTYQDTEFYKACTDEEECIFFLDEIDASIPEALVLINAAIANGYFEFPNGKVILGNVHFVAAGNTVGSGADELYTGRMVLDQATLDRFAIIEFDYSEPIELKLTKGNKDLVKFVRELREKAKSTGVRATFSYRCLIMVTKLEETTMSLEDIITITILKGMDKDTIRTLAIYGTTKYHNALAKIRTAA